MQSPRAVRGLVAVTVLAGVACEASGLPERRPGDFQLTLSWTGGIVPRGGRITISAAGAGLEEYGARARPKAAFRPSEAELDALYAALRQNRCDRIETREETVYDRGGKTLTWVADGVEHIVSNASTRFVEEPWREAWSACVEAVESLAAAHVPQRSEPQP